MGSQATASSSPHPQASVTDGASSSASDGTPQTPPPAMMHDAPCRPELVLTLTVEIAELLTADSTLAPLVSRAAVLIRDHLGIEDVGIYRYDATHNTIQPYVRLGARPPWMPETDRLRLPARGSRSLQEGAPLQEAILERRMVQVDGHDTSTPWTVMPLAAADKIIGALILHMRTGGEEKPSDETAIQALAQHLAIVIHHAERYDTEHRQREFAEKLNAVGHALSQTLDLSEILGMVLGQLATIVPHDRSSIMLEEDDAVVIRAARGFPKEANPLEIRVPIREDDVYGTIRRTQQPLVIPDVAARPDWQYVEDLPRARSWLGVPLVQEREVIGMLSLTRERPQPFTDEEVTLSASFAHEAAMALHNARLYANLGKVNTVLERAIAELRQRTEELEITNQKLKRLDQAKSDFITVASHELRTPLTVLSGYSQMLMGDAGLKRDDYRWQLVKGMQAGTDRLCAIVDSMLDMARVDNRALELKPEPLFLGVLIKSVVSSLKYILDDRDINFTLSEDIDELPMIEADTASMRKVFYHLIVNGIKYTPDGGSVRVLGRSLKLHEDAPVDGWVEIIVSDTGIGIDPSVQELIFAKFYQTGQVASHSSGISKFKGGGPGLGLAITRGIVEAHGGRVWVESPGYDEIHCPGSEFHVVLPVRPNTVVPDGLGIIDAE